MKALVFSSILLGVGCSSATPPPATPADVEAVHQGHVSTDAPWDPAADPAAYQRYAEGVWAMAVPAHWTRETPSNPVILVHFVEPTPTEGFRTNVNIATEPYAGTLEQYVVANIASIGDSATVVDQVPSQAGGRPAVEVEGDWPTASVTARAIQLYTVNGSEGYVVTCMGARSVFEQVRPTCRAIFDSVRLH